VDPGPVLGLPELRAAFLVDVSATESRKTEGGRASLVAESPAMTEFNLQDEDEDDDEDEDQNDDDDDEEDDDEEVETWQVRLNPSTTASHCLTSAAETA
jgi:hypothetical protein